MKQLGDRLSRCVCGENNIGMMADRIIVVDGVAHTDNFCGPVEQQLTYSEAQTLDGGSPTPGVEDMSSFARACICGEVHPPEMSSFAGGGMREPQGGRPRFELLWPKDVPYDEQMLTRFASHMAKGAAKYADRNWESFSDEAALERAQSSALRHVYQWLAGNTDEDHAAAILFNVMAAEHVKRKLESS